MGARWYDAQLGRWISADTIVPSFANPQSLNRFAYVYNSPLNYVDPSGHVRMPWQLRMGIMLGWIVGTSLHNIPGLSYPRFRVLRNEPLNHGLADACGNKESIDSWADEYDVSPLIVAASIAHQASDFIDRPYGSDMVEKHVQPHLTDRDISVGIAQIKEKELERYAPDLIGNKEALFDPDVAVRVMSAKMAHADGLLQDPKYAGISTTDRYMLLAIVQNSDNPDGMTTVFDAFIDSGMKWGKTLEGNEGWTGQVRSVGTYMFLLSGTYELPEGLDMEYWLQNAFADIKGVDY
jgi:hypothetical protein